MTDPVRAEAIRTLFAQSRSQTAAGFVVTGYMAGTAWGFTDKWRITFWAAAVLTIIMVRWTVSRLFRRLDPPDEDTMRWARIYTGLMAVAGLLWGASFLLFAHPDEPITVALTLSCLYSIAAGSTPSSAYNPVAIYGLVVPIFAAVLVKLLLTGEWGYVLLGSASALYGVTMIGYCKVQGRAVEEGFRIRFENAELLEAVRREKAEADEARREAELASLAKSQFLAAASHDLRQPLYALSLFSSSLDELRLDGQGRDVVQRIQDSIGVMDSLFDGLLDLSKLEAGVVQANFAPVAVDALFDRLAQVFNPHAEARGIELRLRSDGEVAWSDAVLLEQVLANLVSNAIRHTSEGAVLLAVRRRGGALRFEVWDTGVGIADDDLQRIFDEYVQLDNPQRDRRKGLGLGLSIARRSAALIGARITVSSRVGSGSFFSLLQPEFAGDIAAPIEGRRAAALPVLARDHSLPVLLVEDDEDVRLAFSDLLARWGVALEAVDSAAAALALVAEGRRFGLVISDQRLGGDSSGLELIARLRTLLDPAPPMLLVTGDWDPQLIETAAQQAVPIVHKPVQAAQLRALLGLAAETDQ